MASRWVVGFNGARDQYQVPLALYEIDGLCAFVTDLAFPSWFKDLPVVGNLLARRCLPPGMFLKTHICWRALFYQINHYLKVSKRRGQHLKKVDRAISIKCKAIALRHSANLFMYSYYTSDAFSGVNGLTKVMFQVHPLGGLVSELLRRDYEKYTQYISWYEEEDENKLGDADVSFLAREWQSADFIVCASEFTKRTLVYEGCSPEKVSVVPYGLAASVGQIECRIDVSDGVKCRFLFVGQGVQRKGLHHLLISWRSMPKSFLDNSELIIVSRRLDPKMAELANECEVSVISGVSDQGLQQLYLDSDVFILPSLVEGFGLVLLEALSYGCFLISTNNTGLQDMCLAENSYICFDAGSVGQLMAALNRTYLMFSAGLIHPHSIANNVLENQADHFRESIQSVVRGYEG